MSDYDLTVEELAAMHTGEVVHDSRDESWTATHIGSWARERGLVVVTGEQLVQKYGPLRRAVVRTDRVPEGTTLVGNFRQRPGDQPLPTASTGIPMHVLAAEVIGERAAIGLDRYGQPLQAMNGRDAVRDVIEELADGLVYALQVREERRLLREELDGLLDRLDPGGATYAHLYRIVTRYFPEEP